MTLLWYGHVYKCSYRVTHCELCEWPVRERARLSAQPGLPRFDGAAWLHPQGLRSGSSAVPSRLYEMRTLLAPLSTAQT